MDFITLGIGFAIGVVATLVLAKLQPTLFVDAETVVTTVLNKVQAKTTAAVANTK